MEQIVILIADSAYADLEDIENYISQDSHTIARRFIGKIFNRIAQLNSYPQSGKIVTEFKEQSIRELLLDKYRIVYKIDSESQITILRIVHGARLIDTDF